MNDALICSLWAVIIAQWFKLPIYYFKNGEWDWKIVTSTGSMPSSHTAFVTSLAISIGLIEGIDSAVFALAFVFALITIHDAVKVRGESGKQAKILNQMQEDFYVLTTLVNVKEFEKNEEKLKELIGHTGTEIIGGLFIGIITPFLIALFI